MITIEKLCTPWENSDRFVFPSTWKIPNLILTNLNKSCTDKSEIPVSIITKYCSGGISNFNKFMQVILHKYIIDDCVNCTFSKPLDQECEICRRCQASCSSSNWKWGRQTSAAEWVLLGRWSTKTPRPLVVYAPENPTLPYRLPPIPPCCIRPLRQTCKHDMSLQ